jgi:predicted HicB family RNase H-like nuclease
VAEQADEKPVSFGTGTIKIAPELAWKLRMIAEYEGISIAKLIDPILRKRVEERFAKLGPSISKLASK